MGLGTDGKMLTVFVMNDEDCPWCSGSGNATAAKNNRVVAEIWAKGNWGTGSTRVTKLTAHGDATFGKGSGAQFAKDVQDRVNATDPNRK